MQSTTSMLECSHCRQGGSACYVKDSAELSMCMSMSTLLLGILLTSSSPHFSPESCLWQADSSSVTIARLKTRNTLRTHEKVYFWIEKQSYDILEKQCQMGHVGIQLPETARVILSKGKTSRWGCPLQSNEKRQSLFPQHDLVSPSSSHCFTRVPQDG